jgi:hypothetical protein
MYFGEMRVVCGKEEARIVGIAELTSTRKIIVRSGLAGKLREYVLLRTDHGHFILYLNWVKTYFLGLSYMRRSFQLHIRGICWRCD